jgi:hypothetical protein
MQLKLHRWASEDAARRFGDLFNLVYDPAFLVHAWERVAGNVGARTAGVDGVTVAQIETRVGVGVFLGQVRDSLRCGEYRPSPVRQVRIPKGGGKLRRLGIPTVVDRVVQAACKAVLEPELRQAVWPYIPDKDKASAEVLSIGDQISKTLTNLRRRQVLERVPDRNIWRLRVINPDEVLFDTGRNPTAPETI